MRKRLLNKQAMSLLEDPTSSSRELEEIHFVGEKPSEKHRMTSGQKLMVLQSTVIEYIWEVFVSVNPSCAQPLPPPLSHTHTSDIRADPKALTPGHLNFFCLGWKIPGDGGDSWAVKSPAAGTKKEGKCPVLRQHCNIFHWSHSRIVPF